MGGSAPPDNSAQVAQIEAQAARDARAEQAKAEALKLKQFNKKLAGAFGSGVSGAESFFGSQGLDPSQYSSKIRQRATDIRGGIPENDANPASYFADLGQQIYDQEQAGERSRDLRGIDTYAPAGFASKRIADTSADDLIQSILGTQQQTADDYISNLLNRGVVTGGGADAARKNLAGQVPTAKSRLSELTRGLLEKGRGGAEDMAAGLRTTAANQRLGDQFDPYAGSQDLSKYFDTFFSGLGEKVRGVAPTDLFSTAGLANVAGAAQGAGNQPFNPNALAGIFDDDEEKKDTTTTTSPF
jgi:hypothetical protein